MENNFYTVNMQAISDCALAISKEEARYYLGGVYIHDDEEYRHYAGTDGHVLVHFEEPILGERLKEGIIVEPLAKIKMGRRRDEADNYGTLQIIDKDTAILKDNYQKIACDIIDGNYPNYMRVVPDDNTPEAKEYTGFNAKYMQIVQKVCQSVTAPKALDKSSPHIWRGDKSGMEYFVVLMPMRL